MACSSGSTSTTSTTAPKTMRPSFPDWRWLLVLVLALAGEPSSAAEPLRLGINALWIPGDAATLRERFRKARAMGISEVRLDWEWRQVEFVRGEYRWDKLDTL